MSAVRRTRIITHTGSDLPIAEAEALGVAVIPDIVLFGEQEYKNMTELSAEVFYEKMAETRELPTSSHPSPGEFVRFFSAPDIEEEEILFLSITSKMSGTYNTALTGKKLAQRKMPGRRITVYDTQQCSHGMAQMVRLAAEYASQGLSADQIIEKLEHARPNMGVYFMLDTLENARKGGRVGAIKAMAADAMNIKPLLLFDDGVVRDFDFAFGKRAGMEKLLKLFEKEADLRYTVTVFHAMVPEQAEALAGRLSDLGAQVRIAPVGPVIGIYTGRGCIGFAFTKK